MNGSFTLFSLFQAFHMYQISFQEATKLIYKSQKKKKKLAQKWKFVHNKKPFVTIFGTHS